MKTKEQMIEQIREKVIMANNPDCKTYEEVLEKEYHLGLPLTLERILVALNKDSEEINDYYTCGEFIYDKNDHDIIFPWQPNKTIENQSEDTIEQIYQILC